MITNNSGVSVQMAVMALASDYDFVPQENSISATSLLKPVRSIVLGAKTEPDKDIDIIDLIPSMMGNALHAHFENAWKTKYKIALSKLGYPQDLIDKIVINPEEVAEKDIPIYLEKRADKEIKGWTISGKYDMVMEGRVHDLKSTSVWGEIFGSNTDDYIKQGSIYRWLNPNIIIDDTMCIEMIFTDWSASKAKQDADYPDKRVIQKELKLMSLQDTEHFILGKINEIEKYLNLPLESLLECTKDELWQKDPIHKYYKDPAKLTRATKNFNELGDALARQAKDGGGGKIISFPGEVKRCIYCAARPSCTQADQLALDGALKD